VVHSREGSLECQGYRPLCTQAASCAQTLAAFLSLPGYKVVNVQPGAFSGGAFYTIAGPSRNQH
jgi:hypothetical protein